MHNPVSVLWDFDIETVHIISAKRPDLTIINNKKKENLKIVDYTVPADHRIKLKESKKRDEYQDLARELEKLWNMKVTIIPILIGAFGTVTRGLLKGQEDLEVGRRVETIQITALLRTGRILRRVLETCCHSNSSENHQLTLRRKKSDALIIIIIITIAARRADFIIIKKKKKLRELAELWTLLS